MNLLCFDPGETIGYAVISDKDKEAVLGDFGNVAYADFKEWLKLNRQLFVEADAVVVEEYQVLPGKAMAHAGSKLETTRAIGNIELMASIYDLRVQFSRAANNKQNLKISGMGHVLKIGHSSTHWVYAYAHGYALLVRLGKLSHAKAPASKK